MKREEPLNDKFDRTLARIIAKAIRERKYRLQGADRILFLAGQLSRKTK